MKRSKAVPIAEAVKLTTIGGIEPELALLRRIRSLKRTHGIDLLVRLNERGKPRWGVDPARLKKHAPKLFGLGPKEQAAEEHTDALLALGRKVKELEVSIEAVQQMLALAIRILDDRLPKRS